MIDLATFDILPIEDLEALIYYWPEAEAYSVNFEMAGVDSLLFLANIGSALYLIYLHILAALLHLCLHKMRNKANFVKSLHAKLGEYLYWRGVNRFFMEFFLDLTFLSILNLHTVNWKT